VTVLIFIAATLGAVVLVQNAALVVLGQPLQLAIDARAGATKAARLALKLLLQATLLAALACYPLLAGSSVSAYYGTMLAASDWHYCWQGWLFAVSLLGALLLAESITGCFVPGARCARQQLPARIALKLMSCVMVAAVEEPFFRGILLRDLLPATGAGPAIVLSAALFSGAHFLRRHKETWAAIGLFVLGVQLGIAFVVTGSLWLAMGLHSGGVLAIQVHRLLVERYRGPAWLIGTKDFPVAGVACITLMVAISVGIWRFLQ